MNDVALKSDAQEIEVDEVFPHTPEKIWKTLTTGDLIGRWLMPTTGFDAVKGRERNAPSSGPLRLRAAEERNCFHEYERRLEKGCRQDRRDCRREVGRKRDFQRRETMTDHKIGTRE